MKNIRFKALLVVALPLTAACNNEVDNVEAAPPIVDSTPPPLPVGQPERPSSSAEAQAYFREHVYPALTDPASPEQCVICHAVGHLDAPGFLTASADSAYKVVLEYNGGALAQVPEKNLLLTKGKHDGPDLNSLQRTAVMEWLKLEYPNRPLPTGIKTVYDALFNFGNCMNWEEFLKAGLDKIALTPLKDDANNCALCHSLAQAGKNGGSFVLDLDGNITFDNARNYPGVLKFVTPEVNASGTFSKLVEAYRISEKGDEPNQVNADGTCASAAAVSTVLAGNIIDVTAATYCHPNYKINVTVQDALSNFIGSTLNRANTQVCTVEDNPGG